MKEIDAGKKALIERAKKDQSIMEICRHEYLGDYGKMTPEGWQPSDKEVLAVIERIGY
jgi:hypothetical protein